jgi:O-antigen/teichoic acid export membrane protein
MPTITYEKRSLRSAWLFIWLTSMGANFINWIYNIFLNRVLSLDEYSQVAAILNILLIISGFAVSVQYAATKFLPQVKPANRSQTDNYLNALLTISLSMGIAISAIAWLTLPIWTAYLHLTISILVDFLLASTFIIFIVLSAVKGICLGWRLYVYTGLLLLSESLVKLTMVLFGFRSGQTLNFSLIAIPLSMFISLSIGLFVLAHRGVHFRFRFDIAWTKKIIRFAVYSFITTMGAQLLLFIDVVVVRHNFSSFDAGIYATVSLIGKMIFFLITSLLLILAPEVSVRSAQALPSASILKKSLIFTFFVGFSSTLLFALFPNQTLSLFLDPFKVVLAKPLIPYYGLTVTLIGSVVVMSTYYLFAGYRRFILILCLALIFQIILLSLFHSSLMIVVGIMLLIALLLNLTLPLASLGETRQPSHISA